MTARAIRRVTSPRRARPSLPDRRWIEPLILLAFGALLLGAVTLMLLLARSPASL